MLSRYIAKSGCSPRCEVTFLIDRNIPSGCREHDSVVLAWYVSCNLANQQASARRSRLLHVGELISGISNVVNSDSVLPGTRSRFTSLVIPPDTSACIDYTYQLTGLNRYRFLRTSLRRHRVARHTQTQSSLYASICGDAYDSAACGVRASVWSGCIPCAAGIMHVQVADIISPNLVNILSAIWIMRSRFNVIAEDHRHRIDGKYSMTWDWVRSFRWFSPRFQVLRIFGYFSQQRR